MAKTTKKKPKAPNRMTSDELIDELFDPKVRQELKKLAHQHRPKPPKKG